MSLVDFDFPGPLHREPDTDLGMDARAQPDDGLPKWDDRRDVSGPELRQTVYWELLFGRQAAEVQGQSTRETAERHLQYLAVCWPCQSRDIFYRKFDIVPVMLKYCLSLKPSGKIAKHYLLCKAYFTLLQNEQENQYTDIIYCLAGCFTRAFVFIENARWYGDLALSFT